MHMLHDRGGGTDLHVRGLVAALHGWRHVMASVAGDRIDIRSFPFAGAASRRQDRPGPPAAPDAASIERASGEAWRDLMASVAAAFRISLIHVHHLAESPFSLVSALPALGIPYGVTIHDLWFACPTVTLTRGDGRYCGGVTATDECRRCLAAQPAFAAVDIGAWRRRHAALFRGAAFTIAPSRWAADVTLRYFPALAGRMHVVSHALPSGEVSTIASGARARAALPLPDDGWPVVAFIGALGPDKGARRIERLAALAREQGRSIRFVVIGYLETRHEPWQSEDARLTVHGRYARSDLPALIAHYRPRFVCFPSDGPESFSYTLSEAWSAHLPALVPPIGALAERVEAAGAGWIMSEAEWRDDARLLARIVELASSGSDAAFAAARTVALPRAAEMAAGTAECYAGALRAAAAAVAAGDRR